MRIPERLVHWLIFAAAVGAVLGAVLDFLLYGSVTGWCCVIR